MGTRTLSAHEMALAEFMLRNGTAEARSFLGQLERAEATDWRCPCGCASYNFQVADLPEAPPGVNILGDYLFGEGEGLAGVFIYESGGILSGVEVYGLGGDAPRTLPEVSLLQSLL